MGIASQEADWGESPVASAGFENGDGVVGTVQRMPLWAVVLIAALGIAGLAFVDAVTGPDLAFSLFYLVPIVFATWFGARQAGFLLAVLAAVTWGALDYAGGAVHGRTIIELWNTGIRLSFFHIIVYLLSALRQAQDGMSALAHTDVLTGLMNSRAFHVELDREIDRHKRYGRPFVLAYIDLDHFKSVNDTHGHAAGDALLRRVADAMRGAVREYDIVARIGGDEFGVLMPETQEQTAAGALERVRGAVADAVIRDGDADLQLNATIGAVIFHDVPASADDALKMADRLMYEGKQGGRATVRTAVYAVEGHAGTAEAISTEMVEADE